MPERRTTRERVHQPYARRGARRALRARPPSALQPNPGAGRAKELERIACPPPRSRRAGGRSIPVVFTTTLGNGYLGSRIDEERSEMRYLV